jgi:hypothetical protein
MHPVPGHRHFQRQRTAAAVAAATVLLILLWSNTAAAVLLSQRQGSVLSLMMTGCSKYQDWQAVAAAFAWRQSGQPGSLVRVANCDDKGRKDFMPGMLEYVATHMAKQVICRCNAAESVQGCPLWVCFGAAPGY